MFHLRIRSMARNAALIAATAYVLAFAAAPARAHPGHEENSLGTEQWNSLGKGLHSAGGGLSDDSLQADPPTAGRGLTGSGLHSGLHGGSNGGAGGLHGDGLGSYGAGSVGEPAAGGLGAMKTGGMGNPPRPR